MDENAQQIIKFLYMKSNILLPLYASIFVVALVIIIFFLDKDTPKTIFIFLLLMYIGLLLFYWRQYKSQTSNQEIRSLSQFSSASKSASALANFEQQCRSILQQISMQKKVDYNDNSYYSPYSHTARYPTSLRQIHSPINDYSQQGNIFGTYSIQVWKQQFRQALQQFKQNLGGQIKNQDVYKNLLVKLNLKIDKLLEAEEVVDTFLKDRSTLYCTQTPKFVNQANKILSRNFGLSLTKADNVNSKQISMQQLSRLLNFYSNNRTLPSQYKKKSINPPSQSFNSQIGISIERSSRNKLDSDMEELAKCYSLLQPMMYYPSQRFNPCLLVHILRTQFPNQKILVNKQNSQNRENNVFNSFVINRQSFVYIFLVQIDHWISLAYAPEFRTKNCLKICLVFLLTLIKKQSNTGHPLLRRLKQLLK